MRDDWNIGSLRKALTETVPNDLVQFGMRVAGWMPFPPAQVADITDDDILFLKKSLNIHQAERYSRWPSVYARLNINVFHCWQDSSLDAAQDALFESPFSALARPVDLDDGAIHHRIFEIGAGGQRPEHPVENVCLDPSAKALEYRIPLAEFPRQLAPLRAGAHDPQHRFHEQPRVAPGLAGIAGLAKAKWLDDRPLGISQNSSGQGCSPLFATLNQNSRDLGILNLNRP